jgi:hypothetical protein
MGVGHWFKPSTAHFSAKSPPARAGEDFSRYDPYARVTAPSARVTQLLLRAWRAGRRCGQCAGWRVRGMAFVSRARHVGRGGLAPARNDLARGRVREHCPSVARTAGGAPRNRGPEQRSMRTRLSSPTHRRAYTPRVESQCRICGELWPLDQHLPAHQGGGCPSCGGSPLCDTCGHPRRDHVGAFSGNGKQQCRTQRHDIQVLDVATCRCTQYVPRTGRFSDAKFAEPDPDVGGPIPRLRPPGEASESVDPA